MMNGVVTLLNWLTMMRKIRNRAIKSALLKKAISLACSSCWPVNAHLTVVGRFSSSAMSTSMLEMISVGLAPSNTLDVMVMTRLRSFRLTALNVVARLAVATALMGTSLI